MIDDMPKKKPFPHPDGKPAKIMNKVILARLAEKSKTKKKK